MFCFMHVNIGTVLVLYPLMQSPEACCFPSTLLFPRQKNYDIYFSYENTKVKYTLKDIITNNLPREIYIFCIEFYFKKIRWY